MAGSFCSTRAGTPAAAGIYLGALDGTPPTRLTAADSGGAFLPPDQVVFVQQGTLVARRLDLVRRVLTGDPVRLADRIGVSGLGHRGFAVSGAGLVAYRAGGSGARQLTWVDRTGKAVGVAGAPDGQDLDHPELSPDGRRVAMQRTVQGNMRHLAGGSARRRADPPDLRRGHRWPIPSGRRTGRGSPSRRTAAGVYDLYLKPSNGAGAEARVLASPNLKIPQTWSRDGRWLLYYELHPTTGRDLWALDMTAPRPRRASSPTRRRTKRWRSSRRTGGGWRIRPTSRGASRWWCSPFPTRAAGGRSSTAGGVAPRWRADGTELYFLAPDATLMAAPVTAAGATFAAGPPVALFPTRIVEGGTIAGWPAAVRGRGRRPVPDQPAGGRRRGPAHHADPELAAAGHAVAVRRSRICRERCCGRASQRKVVDAIGK